MSAAEPQRRLMLTVDVEALPERAERDPVERLIWGHWPDGRRGGIDELMTIADRHAARLVMFFDFPERGFYGEGVIEAAREIDRRGHDLELHAHARFLPREFWEARGLRPCRLTDRISAEQATALFDYVCEQHREVTGRPALGFRGAGYRFNGQVLRAMAAHGVRVNSSYNAGRASQLLHHGPRRQFMWETGSIELPVSCVAGLAADGRLVEFNFNASRFSTPDGVKRMLDYLDTFYEQSGSDAIAVLVMHSWSLSRRGQEDGFFSSPLTEHIERLDGFLHAIKGKVQIVTMPDVVALADAEDLALGAPLPIADLDAAAVQLASADT